MNRQDVLKFITELELAVTKNEIKNVIVDFYGYRKEGQPNIKIQIYLNKK